MAGQGCSDSCSSAWGGDCSCGKVSVRGTQSKAANYGQKATPTSGLGNRNPHVEHLRESQGGYNAGFDNGYTEGYKSGYNYGYDRGYYDGHHGEYNIERSPEPPRQGRSTDRRSTERSTHSGSSNRRRHASGSRESSSGSRKNGSSRTCFSCGQEGHVQRDCVENPFATDKPSNAEPSNPEPVHVEPVQCEDEWSKSDWIDTKDKLDRTTGEAKPCSGDCAVTWGGPCSCHTQQTKRKTSSRPSGKTRTSFGGKLNANIEWDMDGLPVFKKNFYQEHPDVSAVTDEEVAEWRKKHEITVLGEGIPKNVQTFEEASFPGTFF